MGCEHSKEKAEESIGQLTRKTHKNLGIKYQLLKSDDIGENVTSISIEPSEEDLIKL